MGRFGFEFSNGELSTFSTVVTVGTQRCRPSRLISTQDTPMLLRQQQK